MLRVKSGHIIFPETMKYKDLMPVYKEMYMRFLRETNQNDDETNVNFMVKSDLKDLKYNRKPEGFNRKGCVRLIFPIKDNVEVYVHDTSRNTDVSRVTNALSRLLQKRGYEHKVKWDKLLINQRKRK